MMKFHFKLAEMSRSALSQGLLRLGYDRLHQKRKSCRRVNRTLDNLLISCVLTISVYYVFTICLYYQLTTKRLVDPSASLFQPLASLCESARDDESTSGHSSALRHSLNHSDDLKALLKLVKGLLDRTDDYEFFICYRSLFDLLRMQEPFQDANSFDLCVYDKRSVNWMNKINFLRNLLENKIEKELSLLIEKFTINYEYKWLFGYYHLRYGAANLYLYLFVHSSPSKYEYDTIMRYGWLYNQFHYIGKSVDRMSNLETKLNERATPPKSGSTASKLPLYMIEDMVYQVELNDGLSLPIPNDPYTMLMYTYPNDWWQTYENCTI